MIFSKYAGVVTDVDLFKNTPDSYGVPDHLRNTGFSFYLRSALLQTLKEEEFSEEELQQLVVINPKYMFKGSINEGQPIYVETEISNPERREHIGNRINVRQVMKTAEGKHLCTLDEQLQKHKRGPFMRGLIYPAVFDLGRLDLQEKAGLRFQDLDEDNMPLYMVVRSTDYQYKRPISPEENLTLLSGFGEVKSDGKIPLVPMYQALYVGREPVANCFSENVFLDAQTNRFARGYNDEITKRTNTLTKALTIAPEQLKGIIEFNESKRDSISLEKSETDQKESKGLILLEKGNLEERLQLVI